MCERSEFSLIFHQFLLKTCDFYGFTIEFPIVMKMLLKIHFVVCAVAIDRTIFNFFEFGKQNSESTDPKLMGKIPKTPFPADKSF